MCLRRLFTCFEYFRTWCHKIFSCFYILSLGATESLGSYLSSKSSLTFSILLLGVTESLGASISYKFPIAFSSFSVGATESLGNMPMILDDIIPLIDYPERLLTPDTGQSPSLSEKIKALIASEALNFISKTPRSGLGRTLTLTGYISGLTYFT